MMIPTLDNTGVTTTASMTDDVHLVTLSEGITSDHSANFQLCVYVQLTQVAVGSDASLLELTFIGTIDTLVGDLLVTTYFASHGGFVRHLDCLVAVLLYGLHLHYGAGTGLDNGYGDHFAFCSEDLAHS